MGLKNKSGHNRQGKQKIRKSVTKKNSSPQKQKKVSVKKIVSYPKKEETTLNSLTILQNLPSACIVFDLKKVFFVNDKAAKMLGIKQSALKYISTFSLFNFISSKDHKTLKNKCTASGKKECSLILDLIDVKNKKIPTEFKLLSFQHKSKKIFAALLADASENIKLGEELDNYQNNFNLILSCIDEVVYYVDQLSDGKERKVRYISDHIYKVIGTDKESYQKNIKRLIEFCHPDDVPHILREAAKIKTEKKPQKFIYRFKHLISGQYVWLEERVFPQFDKEDNHIGNFGVTRDITTEKDYEQKLKESEQKFRLLAENANDIIYKCNYFPELHYEYMSPSVERILGYSPNRFYKDATFGRSIIHENDLEQIDFRDFEEKSDAPVIKTARYFHNNGNIVWLETSYSFIRNESGAIISIQGISRDVTKEREAEVRLEENEKKFRLLAENANDIIFHFKYAGTPGYTYMSPAVTKILGYTPEDFYNDPMLGYRLVYEEDKPLLARSGQNIVNGIAILKESDSLTVRYVARDGSLVWMQTTFSHVKDENGRILEMEGISRNISKQKESELALLESERKLNNLFSNLPGMAYRCSSDNTWTMQFVSQGSVDLTGYSPEEFIDNKVIPFSQIVHPEDILLGRPEIENALKNKTTFEIEYRIIDKSGEIKWVWEKGEGIYSSSGQLLFIEGFISNISQRKKIEVELNQKWANFQSLVDSSPDGIFILQDTKIVYANPAAMKIIENDDEKQLHLTNLFDYLLPEYHAAAKERMDHIMMGEQSDSYQEYKVKTRSGKILEVESRSIPIIFNGEFALQIIFHDLTAQKQLHHQQIRTQIAEEANIKLQEEIYERKKIEAELRQTQKFSRLLVDSSLDMICAADKEGNIIEFNAAAQQAFGYTFNEIYGKPLTVLYGNAKERTGILNQMVEGEVPFSGEVVNRKKNGEMFISYLSATILKNEKGEFIGSMVVSRDITKIKTDELQLRENEERYRAIYNQAFIGIARIDIYSGKFIEVNHRLCEILGYTKEELIEKTTFEITIKEDRDKLSLADQLSGDGFFVQRRYIHRNGSIVYMNLSYSLVKDVSNNPLYFVVVYDDITKNKIYEQEILNQSSKLKAIFESSSHLVWTVNENYELTSFNHNFSEVIKDKYKISPALNKKLQDYLTSKEALAYSKEWIPKYESVFTGNKIKFEKSDSNRKGEEVFREVFLHPIYDENDNVVEISCIAHDITERKVFERQITEQSAKLNAIFESSSHIIWTLNKDLEITSFNKNYDDEFMRLFDIKPTINLSMPKVMANSLTADEMNLWAEKYAAVFEGKRQQFEIASDSVNPDEKIYREIFLHPIFNDKGEVVEVSGIAQDITERKKHEKQITEQSAQIKAIFNSSSHLIWTVTRDFQVTSYNDNFHKRISSNKDSFHVLKNGKSAINPDNPNYENWLSHYGKAFSGFSQHFETQTVNLDNEFVWTEIFLEPIIGIDGKVSEVSGIAHDITEKKKSDEQVKLSLKEKEVLLKEVHHRVKNNLQVISSILNLQSSYVKDQKTLNLLKECQNRIKSMAFIHESLYQNKDFSAINFSEYIVMLSHNLLHSYGHGDNRVKLLFNVEHVDLNLDLSIPCGLIVNEIISNALKYAFPDGRDGEISINLKTEGEMLYLSISDNGVGLPEELDFRNTESLGLQLVVTLVEQLNGEIAVDLSNGTNFLINFTFNTNKN